MARNSRPIRRGFFSKHDVDAMLAGLPKPTKPRERENWPFADVQDEELKESLRKAAYRHELLRTMTYGPPLRSGAHHKLSHLSKAEICAMRRETGAVITELRAEMRRRS
jgi:hypothetical protein